jgi:hypothetical protein
VRGALSSPPSSPVRAGRQRGPASGTSRTAARGAARRHRGAARLQQGPAEAQDARQAHDRHGQAGVRPLVRGRRPDERQGASSRPSPTRGREAGLRPGRRHLDRREVRQPVLAPGDDVRLRHQPDLDQRRAQEGRRLLQRLLRRAQAIVTVKGQQDRRREEPRRPQGRQARRATGTTSYDAIVNTIKPSSAPATFPDNDKAKLALSNGQVDGLVVDLPTALYLANADIKGRRRRRPSCRRPVVRRSRFGLLLEKGSPLTQCVTQAVDALRSDGTSRSCSSSG